MYLLLEKLLRFVTQKNNYRRTHQEYWSAFQRAEEEREEMLDKLLEVRTLIGKSNSKLAGYILKAEDNLKNLQHRQDADGILLYNLTKAFRDAALEHINGNNVLIAKLIHLKK